MLEIVEKAKIKYKGGNEKQKFCKITCWKCGAVDNVIFEGDIIKVLKELEGRGWQVWNPPFTPGEHEDICITCREKENTKKNWGLF